MSIGPNIHRAPLASIFPKLVRICVLFGMDIPLCTGAMHETFYLIGSF